MKKIQITLILLVVFGINASAQSWMKGVTKANPNFFDIQKAFYDNYREDTSETDNIVGENDGDYEKFKRWEWYWEQRVGRTGEFPPANVQWTEWDKYTQSHPKLAERTTTATATWTFMGPTVSTGFDSGYVGVGRVSCIAFHPTIANTFWVGTPAGGLWKTTDGGSTWSTNTDHLPVLGISDIAINSTNPNIMYIATGDGDLGGADLGDTKSIGVLKTIDGGTTWNTTGLSWSVTIPHQIRRLIIDPTNPSILLAAATNGIYRTTDGGVTWTNVEPGYIFMDILFHPTNHNIIYASTFNPSGGAQIYRSIDNGLTWGFTSITGISRIKLAVSPAFPVEVDALCVNTTGPQGLEGLWYSIDNGSTFNQYWTGDCTHNLLGYGHDASGCNGQGNYDLAYAINPINESEFFIGGVHTWKSSDSGILWNIKNYFSANSWSIPVVHSDKHWLAYHPLVSNTLFECNDGGLYKTMDGGTTWTNLTSGLGISEIYRIGTSATVANNVICGLQDNGSKEFNSGAWNNRTGGDGTECLIDYTNANIQYATYVKGRIYKTTNDWASQTTIVNTGSTGVNSDGAWVTPYLMHPTNHNTLIVGKSQVYQSTDGGSTWVQLGTITGASGNIRAMAYAPSLPTTIYVAYDTTLYKTTNGGVTWSALTSSVVGDVFTYIAVNPTNPIQLWVTMSGYTAGAKVFGSTDGGSTWTNWSGSLPNVPANCIVYSNVGSGGLYVGTDLGVYYFGMGLTDWVPFNTGLPNVVVSELEISYINNKLWAATFGRGLWSTDLYLAPAPITGVANVCIGSTTTLSDATVGGTWSSSLTTVATVASISGIVTGVSAGTATITYSVTGYSYITTTVTVNPFPASISGTASLCVGLSTTLSDTSSGGTWSSRNTAIATVSGGIITSVSAGIDTIRYTLPSGCFVIKLVTVNPNPASIIGADSVCQGFTATLTDAITGGTWSSSNITIATVSGGIISGVSTGIDTISYTISTGCASAKTITINAIPASITGIDSVCVGLATTLTDATIGGTWSSNNTAIATVSAGIITGVAAGIVTINYTSSTGCNTIIIITVSPLPCTTIASNIGNNNHVNIFPNPAFSELIIDFNNNMYTSFIISNSIGQKYIQQPLNGLHTNVNINMLPNGLYYIKLIGKEGSWVGKFIKM